MSKLTAGIRMKTRGTMKLNIYTADRK